MVNLTIFSSNVCVTGQVMLTHDGYLSNKSYSGFFPSVEKAREVIQKVVAQIPYVTAIISGNTVVIVEVYTHGVKEETPTLVSTHFNVF